MIGVDLERALKTEKAKSLSKNPDSTLEAFKELLAADDAMDQLILERIFKGGSEQAQNLDLGKLKTENIFHLNEIKSLCTKYRLRFLDSRLFKGEIPYEALSKVKALQKDHEQEIESFKMVAPAPMFNLENKDKDPLLMIPLGNNHYYLVHKWGKDLHPLRALMVFPFRSFKTLLFTVAALAALVVSLFPDSMLMGPYDQHSWNIRVIFFFYLFLAFSGLTALYGFSRMKNFGIANI